MKRTLLLGSAWTASAAAAVGLGFLAISLVDASASSGGATLTTSSGGSSTAAAPVTASPEAAPSGQQVTLGGTVYGSCENGVPVLASAPAAGWWLDDSNDVGEAEFENGTLKIEVNVRCVDGVPQFFVEGPRNDSSHGRDDRSTPSPTASPSSSSDDGVSTPSAATTTAATTTASASSSSSAPSSGDDSDGRVGGGHGSDDSGPDDSGSDDSGSDDSGSDDSGDDSDDDSSGRVGGGHGTDD